MDLVDLLGVDLTGRAAVDGEVLAGDKDLAAVDRTPPGDHTVGVRPVGGVGVPGPGQHVHLVKAAVVEQILQPLPGQHLALVVLALDGPLRPGAQGLLFAGFKFGYSFGQRMIGHNWRLSASPPATEVVICTDMGAFGSIARSGSAQTAADATDRASVGGRCLPTPPPGDGCNRR